MKSITVDNFRCFSHLKIDFRKKVNLLIGDNAAGKTSLLKACKYALSAWFSGFSDENTRWQTFNESDFRIIEHESFRLPDEPIRIKFDLNDICMDLHISENDFGRHQPGEQYIGRNSRKNSRSMKVGIAELRDYTFFLHFVYASKIQGQIYPLPLFVSFSTEDIHSKRKIKQRSFMTPNQKASFGYYECLTAYGLFKYWLKRMLVLEETGERKQEMQSVCDAIVKTLGIEGCNIISAVHVYPNLKDVYYEFVDGRKIASEKLSDGYRRLVNIVTDIAFRCYLLNGALYGADAIKKTQGTVLIDEIDMHLHPTLQAKVAKALSNTFEGLQFIITSHAPMVMSSVKTDEENSVFQLSYNSTTGYIQQMITTYGQDISTIIRRNLGVAPRVAEIQEKIDALNQLIDNEDVENARIKLEELRAEFSDSLPELISADANIRFLSDDLD